VGLLADVPAGSGEMEITIRFTEISEIRDVFTGFKLREELLYAATN
jgi:hypothetical protein